MKFILKKVRTFKLKNNQQFLYSIAILPKVLIKFISAINVVKRFSKDRLIDHY